ncbi:MAG: hypothetical protein K2K53_05390, partial [Oscillospiraceae bacterium]|nr:hypothetical protein [Oscillospiraceae bacterium]
PQELLHHLELLLSGGLTSLAGSNVLHTIPRGNVLDVVAEMGGSFFATALDVRALENNARRKIHPRVHISVLKILERIPSGQFTMNLPSVHPMGAAVP